MGHRGSGVSTAVVEEKVWGMEHEVYMVEWDGGLTQTQEAVT